MAGIPRDVKELFILINGFEWKRRVCSKFDQAKFQQLVMEGFVYLVLIFRFPSELEVYSAHVFTLYPNSAMYPQSSVPFQISLI